MSVISSYEAQFSATGVQETKNGFAEIAKAAALADRQARVNSQNLKDYAKTQIQTEREKARAAEMAAKAQAKAAAQSDAMWKKVGAGAAVAAAAVVKFGLDSYKAYQQYAGAVRDVALASGASAEQSSLFLQVLDDFEISAGDVTKAMKAMTKNGMTPTIDTLAQLADKYVAIEDPMKRNEFLMKNLGKAGLEWANALSQGGDALRASSEEVNKNLVLTDEQIKKAEMARLAVDAWADAWEGFKVAIGGAIGELIAANATISSQAEEYEKLTGTTLNFSRAQGDATKNFEAFQAQMARGKATTEFYNAQLGKMKDAAEEDTAALSELSSANAKLINDAISIQGYNDRYKESQQDILNTIAELQAEKDAMNASETEAIADITEKINEQKEKYKEGAEAFGEAQAEKLTMLALEKIAMQDGVAGYSEAEAAKAKLLLDTANIAEESAFRQALAFDEAANAIANGTMAADELNKLLTMMSEHGWSIDVAVNVQKSIDLGSGVGTQTAAQQGAGWQGGFWHGGDVGRGAGIPWLAGGGSSGAAVVGDRKGGGWVEGVSELVFGNFTVVPSAKSKEMLKSGMLGKVPGFAFGGDMGGYTNAPLVKPTYTPTMPRVAPSKSGSGASTVDAIQAIEMQAMDMQASTQNSVTQMQQAAQQMTQSILNSNAQNQVVLESIAAILRHENPAAVGKAVAYEVAKGS